jgi:RNA polymerase sigma-70 factor, ECF subfamily
MNSTHEITNLLQAWNEGSDDALNRLIPLADRELKKIAHKFMNRERANHLLQPSGLINEAWAKLFAEEAQVDWRNRRHFYALLARRMRQVLWDYAKKESKAEHTPLTGAPLPPEKSKEIAMVHQALADLAETNKRAARVVELRYFGGYTVEEVAEILDVATTTVERDWRFARSWLWREMTRNTNQ